MLRKISFALVRVGISFALLYFLFKFNHIDVHSLLASIARTNKAILVVAFLVLLGNYLLCFYRWEMLLKAVNINLPFKRLLGSFGGGVFFSLLLPSSIGGDLARSIDLAVHTKKPREVVATVLMDRLSGYVGLVMIALCSLLLGWSLIKDDPTVLISAGIIIALLVVILLALFNNFLFGKLNKFLGSLKAGRFGERLMSLHEELHIFRHRRRLLLKNLGLSLLIQATGSVTFYLAALSLGAGKEIIYFFIFVPIIGAITLLPISMGGFGVRENISVILFARAGINETASGAMSLLVSFFMLLAGLIGGLLYYVFTVHNRRVQRHQSPSLHPVRQ